MRDLTVTTTNEIQKTTWAITVGQNPGLIQHYVLYALNNLNKRINNAMEDDYRPESMINAIKTCKVGTILMSEIDNMFLKKLFDKKLLHKLQHDFY